MDNFNNYSLWIARYENFDNGEIHNFKPVVPNNGKIDIWQYSEKGNVDGINGNVALNICYREIIPQATSDLLNITGKEQIIPLSINCGSKGEDLEFYKTNYYSGNFNSFNIYNIKSNHCRKSTLEMMEEMVKNYVVGYNNEYYDLFNRI